MHREKNHTEAEVKEEVVEQEVVATPEADTSTAEATEEQSSEESVGGKKIINIKVAIVIAMLIIVLAVLYSVRGMFVAATVNGSPIGRMSVVSQLEKASGQKLLDTLITKKLIAQEVAKEGKKVTEESIQAEIKKLESQVTAAGSGTLEELLAQQGMTMADLRDQIVVQKQLELLLGDKIAVTNEEVTEYITKNKLAIPAEQMEAARTEIGDQMKQQKMSTEGQKLVAELRAKASISYFVHY